MYRGLQLAQYSQYYLLHVSGLQTLLIWVTNRFDNSSHFISYVLMLPFVGTREWVCA